MTSATATASLVVALGLGVCLGAQGGAPAGTQSFRAGVDVVYVDVSVLDRDRRPIRDLTADDFTIREDGRVRPVVAFQTVDIAGTMSEPSTAGDARAASIPSDVATNAFSDTGRLVVVVMDTTASRSSDRANEVRARTAARTIVDGLHRTDMAAVTLVGLGTPQGFTADRTLLHAAIDQPFQGFAETDGGMRSGACACSCSLETLADVAAGLATVPQRRKILFYVGSSLIFQATSVAIPPCVREIRERLFVAAKTANLTIHTIDPSGLETLAPRADTGLPPGRDRTSVMTSHLRRQDNLKVLPDLTGGRAIVNTNDPDEHVNDTLAESETYYVLAFERGAPDDARFHEIDVRVSRRDAIVQARQGYFGPRATRELATRVPASIPAALGDALAGLWPLQELRLFVSTTVLAASDSRAASVLLAIAPQSDGVDDQSASESSTTIDVLTGAFDRFGRSIDYHVQSVETAIAASAQSPAQEVLSNLTVPPGKHEIRVAVHDRRSGRRGSVYTYVDVPDFTRRALSLSSIVVTSAPALPPAAAAGAWASLPLLPTTVRSFRADEALSAFVRVYQAERAALLDTIVVNAELNDAGGVVVRAMSRRLTPDELGTERHHDVVWPVALDGLLSGDYVLTFEAMNGDDVVRGQTTFVVKVE